MSIAVPQPSPLPPPNPNSNICLGRRATWPTELLFALTGGTDTIGTLIYLPAIIIFDNQSANPVAIYVNQTTNVWHTFPAGEAIVIDLRANHGIADNFTSDLGTTFYGIGTEDSGNFSISGIGVLPT
jgi:hypothetical protein